jgi:CheY-like chemotaxis protein
VLLVEDNEMNIPMIQNCLEAHGYRVAIARNGLEALQRIKSRCPDLVLMDIQMPEMNGIEATRQIRAETSLAQLPIIALTSLVMPGDREKCLAAGMNDFLAKPLSLRRLTRAIAQYLAQKHPSISTMQ